MRRFSDIEKRAFVHLALKMDGQSVAAAKWPGVWAEMIEGWEAPRWPGAPVLFGRLLFRFFALANIRQSLSSRAQIFQSLHKRLHLENPAPRRR